MVVAYVVLFVVVICVLLELRAFFYLVVEEGGEARGKGNDC